VYIRPDGGKTYAHTSLLGFDGKLIFLQYILNLQAKIIDEAVNE